MNFLTSVFEHITSFISASAITAAALLFGQNIPETTTYIEPEIPLQATTTEVFAVTNTAPVAAEIILAPVANQGVISAPATNVVLDEYINARFTGLLSHVRWLIEAGDTKVVYRNTDGLFDKQIEKTTDDVLDSIGDTREALELRLDVAEATLDDLSLVAASSSILIDNLNANGNWLSGDGDSEGIFIDSNGLVGIGTSTPGVELLVDGDMRVTGSFRDSTNSVGTAGMVLQTTGSGTQWVATSSLGITGGGSSFSTSAELAALLSDEVGTGGGFVRASSSVLTSPNIFGATLTGSISGGTFSSGTWQGNAIASTYLDSAIILGTEIDSSAELISLVTDETGTGALVFANSPTLTGTISGASATLSGTLGVTGTTTLATTTATTLTIAGPLRDSSASAGTAGMVLQTTGSGTQWVATSSLGFPGGSGVTNFLALTDTPSSFTANRIMYTNGAATALIDSADFVFTGTNLGLGTSTPGSRVTVSGDISTTYGYKINGVDVLRASSTNHSTAVGFDAAPSVTTGMFNTAVGAFSLFSATSSTANSAVGYGALYSNTAGVYNSALGSSALLFNTTGSYNSGFGGGTLYSNSTGDGNSAFGSYGLYSNTTGGYSTAVGANALYNSIDGGFNLAFGYDAGRYLTDGTTPATSTDFSIFIGNNTKALTGNDQNSIVIGYNASGIGSNSVVLGNDSVNTTVLKGNVGIGTTTPGAKLTVAGDVRITGALRDSSNASGTAGMVLQTTGSGTQWVATSSLGFPGGSGVTNFLALTDTPSSFTANRIMYTNGAATALVDSADFTFDGSDLGLGGSNGIAFGGTRFISASTTNDSLVFGESAGATFSDQTIFNNAIGYQAGRYASNTASDYNNFIGYQAGYNNTNARNNFIGYQAGYNNTALSVVAIGYQAMGTTTGANTDGGVVAIGYQALFNNTSGTENIAVGPSALASNVSGNQNSAFGSNALQFNVSGVSNSAFGYLALQDSTGNNNSAFGEQALTNNTTGLANSAFGSDTLDANITGYYNSAFGISALGGNISGYNNSAMGSLALMENVTGIYNTALGYNAGRYLNDGVTAASTTDYSVYLGSETKALTDNDQNAIVIGYNANGLGSNTVVLGNDNITTTALKGNVGIGTTTPGAKLTVAGDVRITGALRDSSNASGTAGMVLQTTGSGTQWVATSSLGVSFLSLTDTPSSFTANRIMYTNGAATALIDSADFTYDGTNLGLGGDDGIAFGGVRYIAASSTNDSVAFGENAGVSFNGSTTNYVAIGYEAGRYASSSGNYNSMIGYRAGYNSSGLSNNIFGQQAGYYNTGSQNNLFGTAAGFNNTGTGNNFVGTQSGQLSVSGDYNNYIGAYAGRNSTGSYNNLIGEYAGRNNAGSYNDIIGYRSGYFSAGSYNILIGAESMYGSGVASTTRSNNVAIGYRAGYNATTGADNNILVGYGAADNLTSGAKNIVIGYDIDIASTTGSNQLNIGNLIFGTGLDGTGTTISSGKIGVGTTTPTSQLSLVGDIFVTGAYHDSSNTTGPAGYVLQTTGIGTQWVATSSLGIGGLSFTTSADLAAILTDETGSGAAVFANSPALVTPDLGTPSAATLTNATGLPIATGVSGLATGVATFLGTPSSANLIAAVTNETGTGALVFATSPTFSTQLFVPQVVGGSTGASALSLKSTSGVGTTDYIRFLVGNNGATEAMRVTTDGNLGIGTTTPGNKLTVAGDIFMTGAFRDTTHASGTLGMVLQSTGTSTLWVATSTLGLGGGGSLFTDGGATTYLTSTTDNLSIGTTTSSALLTVDGTIAALNGIKFGAQRSVFIDSGSNMTFGEWALFYAEDNANVYANIGIGDNAGNNLRSGFSNVIMGFSAGANMATGSRSVVIGDHAVGNNPGIGNLGSMVVIGDGAGADLEDGANWSTLVGYRAGENITTGSGNTIFGYQAGNNLTTGWENIIIGYDIDAPSASSNNILNIGNLVFGTSIDGTGTTISSGNIGIGTSTPGQKLTVAGTIQATNLLGGSTNLTTDASGNIIRDPSDARLKENVTTIENALDTVLALRGVRYEWIDKSRFGDQVEIGFLAQEVEEYVPEVVQKGGDYWSLNIKNLVAVVVEAMKEMWAEVDKQGREIEELEARIEYLESIQNTTNSPVPNDPVEEEKEVMIEIVGSDDEEESGAEVGETEVVESTPVPEETSPEVVIEIPEEVEEVIEVEESPSEEVTTSEEVANDGV